MFWHPSRERFPRAIEKGDLARNCRALVSRYGRKVSDNTYYIDVYFEGRVLTIEYHYSNIIVSIEWTIVYPPRKILHARSGLQRIPAMEMMNCSNGMKITQIYIGDPADTYISNDLPSKKRGTWIVRFLLMIADSLGAQRVKLYDVSGLREVRLLWLRIFSGKPGSWYRNFGFVDSDEINTAKEVEQLRKTSLSMVQTHPEYPPQETESLSEYMQRLYYQNPCAFNRQICLLEESRITGHLMFIIRQANYSMIKKF